MSEEQAATPSKPRVLVADDEQVIANTLAIILNQAGFEARAVYSGEKAIESLETFQPDMLISDVIMTGMTGIEAAIATREKMRGFNQARLLAEAAVKRLRRLEPAGDPVRRRSFRRPRRRPAGSRH